MKSLLDRLHSAHDHAEEFSKDTVAAFAARFPSESEFAVSLCVLAANCYAVASACLDERDLSPDRGLFLHFIKTVKDVHGSLPRPAKSPS